VNGPWHARGADAVLMHTADYRLLACDLDGTLVQGENLISDGVKSALGLVKEQGIGIVLATGRSFQSALPYASALGVDLPLVCYQGGLVQRADTGEVLYRASLPAELVEEVIDLGQRCGWHLILYLDDEVLLTEYRHSQDVYRRMLGPTVRKVLDLKSAMNSGPVKLTFMDDEATVPTIEREMRTRFAGRMEVFRSHPMFVEGIPVGTSKGTALAWLARYLGVSRDRVVAIGDQDNDVSMLAWASLGIAMGNGSEPCKAVADWIAPDIAEDGAAAAIRRFLLPKGLSCADCQDGTF
jgi:Cof subfamily protein (haloacid dehalogenase superfamily)